MRVVYLGLGGNQGDRAARLKAAREALGEGGIGATKISSLYETEPVGSARQRWFLNQVLRGQTELSPHEILSLAKDIERRQGRRRGLRYGPRPIDIDILLLDGVILRTPELTIPHARLAERRFVLVPLAEIAPGLVHPGLRRTVAGLLRACPDRSAVRLFEPPAQKASLR